MCKVSWTHRGHGHLGLYVFGIDLEDLFVVPHGLVGLVQILVELCTTDQGLQVGRVLDQRLVAVLQRTLLVLLQNAK